MSDDIEKPENPETPAPEPPHDALKDQESEEREPVDAMSPEAIAKRVAAFGEEDEAEKIAREEELKLAERRAKTKGGKKKSGLEVAASKRLEKIGGKVPPKKVALAVDADPLLARTGELGKWLKDNQTAVSALAAIVAIAVFGSIGYGWWQQRLDAKASVEISAAVADETGRVGDPAKAEDEDKPFQDPRPIFKTDAERRDAAIAKYRAVETSYKGTGAAYLSRLEEAALLLDKGDLDGAQAAYTDASSSPLANADPEVKGRALEGLGFVYEARAAAAPAEKDKWLDQAAQQFRSLENTDVQGFKELGMYHQARVAEAKGNKEEAIKLLKSLHERLHPPGESSTQNHPFPFLEVVTDDRLFDLDPTAVPAKPKAPAPGARNPMLGGGGGGGGGQGMSDEQMQKLIEQIKAQQNAKGQGAPPPPAGGK